MADYFEAGALLSEDAQYRYLLWRSWRSLMGEAGTCLFVMLNPSTADGSIDDPTIRRCVAFSQVWGFARLEVVNLYAYRATRPGALAKAGFPVGPDNARFIREAADRAGRIVCAWGAFAPPPPAVLEALAGRKLHCLGFTAAGAPLHPLYQPGTTQAVPYKL